MTPSVILAWLRLIFKMKTLLEEEEKKQIKNGYYYHISNTPTSHSLISVSQVWPVYPAGQLQVKYGGLEGRISEHSPPCWHGDASHSLMSISQVVPV